MYQYYLYILYYIDFHVIVVTFSSIFGRRAYYNNIYESHYTRYSTGVSNVTLNSISRSPINCL